MKEPIALEKAIKTRLAQSGLEAATQIENEWQREIALRYLARSLDESQSRQAIELARQVKDPMKRAWALAVLARRFAEDERGLVLQEALESVRKEPDEALRFLPLGSIALSSSGEARRTAGLEALQALLKSEDLNEIADNLPFLPDEILPEMLAAARSLNVSWARAQTLAELAGRLPEEQKEDVLAEALSAARNVPVPGLRAWVLARLAAEFDEPGQASLAEEAFGEARAAPEDKFQVEALAAVAPLLPANQLAEAVGLARQISDPGLRAEALASLAPALQGEDHRLVVEQAFEAVRALPDEWQRAALLGVLTPSLPPGLREAAFRTAREIEDPWARTDALGGLVSGFSGELRDRALEEGKKAALSVPDAWGRARAFANLAARL